MWEQTDDLFWYLKAATAALSCRKHEVERLELNKQTNRKKNKEATF